MELRTGIPDYPETERISADALAQWVDGLSWSLNGKYSLFLSPLLLKLPLFSSYVCAKILVKFVLDENAVKKRTPTSRIGTNYRSLVIFLARNHELSESDMTYLLDECKVLEEDLSRTARVNRIMEAYVWYVQEEYFDKRRTVDETYYGEYEVERISGPRLLVLRRYDPDGVWLRFSLPRGQ